MTSIALKHKVTDYTCMVNGLEDLYENTTQSTLPPYFLFGLSALCAPAYIKDKRSPVPRMFYPNSGQPQRLYDFLQEILGCGVEICQDTGFSNAFKKAKQAIDAGKPVLLGALDMYHLSYLEKFYHQQHIPIHYVLMIGYDENKEQIQLLDCSRNDPQFLSYKDLEKAWDAPSPGFSKKNTLRIFTFEKNPPAPKDVFFAGLKKKTAINLARVPDFIGVSAFGKLAREIMDWQQELGSEAYQSCLSHLVEYFGFPPLVPTSSKGLKKSHHGGRPQFAALLRWGAKEYNKEALGILSGLFDDSSRIFAALAREIFLALEYKTPLNESVPGYLREIEAIETQAFEWLQEIVQKG